MESSRNNVSVKQSNEEKTAFVFFFRQQTGGVAAAIGLDQNDRGLGLSQYALISLASSVADLVEVFENEKGEFPVGLGHVA